MIILTNPENEKHLKGLGGSLGLPDTNHPLRLDRYPVRFDPHIPPRNIEHKWEPPAADYDKFIEYDKSDEKWARVLGLGTVHEIDHGPLFYAMGESAVNSFDWRISTNHIVESI